MARHQVPNNVEVGSLSYGITFVPALKREGEDYGDLWGISEYGELNISINSDTPDIFQRMTLLHEILHTCFFNAGSDLESELEEKVIQQLTPTLFGVLRDNPDVVSFLTGSK